MDFVETLDLEDLPPNSHKVVSVSDREVLLFNEDGEVTAIGNICLHKGGPLNEGKIERKYEGHYYVTCHLSTGNLLYFHSEQRNPVDLIHDNVSEQVRDIVTKYGLNAPEIVTRLTNLRAEDLSYYRAFARKANESLELFRMRLREHFTQVRLWPHGFDFSVEWFTGKNEQQIGIGISPGHDKYGSPYLYVSPYPFDENVTKEVLPVGIWHTDGWNGIKLEWKELENKLEQEISMQIFDLFVIAKRNFE
jgi:Rieske 2Fe-2S protein